MAKSPSLLGVAVVGTGASAGQHLEALADVPGVRVRLVCEPVADAPVPDRVAGHPVARGLDAAFGADIDVVAVCTPPGTHAEVARRALRAGKAVVVEKPPVLDEAELRALLRERDRAGRPVGVMFQHRFILSPRARALRWSGRTAACLEVCRPRPAAYFEKAPWRSDPAQAGGGTVAHLASHYLDLACQLLGAPEQVEGVAACDHHPGIDTRVAASLRFASGATLALLCTANVEERSERLTIRDGGRLLEIENGRVRIAGPEGVDEADPRVKVELRRAVYAEVAEALRHGRTALPTADVEHALGVVRVLERVRALALASWAPPVAEEGGDADGSPDPLPVAEGAA